MIRRDIQDELLYLSKNYPIVTITGPRQAGKTTIAKHVFSDYKYCNLEIPEIRELATHDPNAFFKEFPCPVIIDEVQRVPQLLSYIQSICDESGKKGMFILTGSHQLRLTEAITQSLAGRTALLRLLPLSIHELSKSNIYLEREEYIYKGFLPGIYKDNLDPTRAYRNYFQTYVERDVRQLIKLKQLSSFENFMRLLAGRVGQVLNLNSISNDLGISTTTLSEWISVLEASYVIFRLFPYYKNYGKRITKTPKLYFTDVGLASYLLGIRNHEQTLRDPLWGNLFENMVVMEAVKSRLNMGKDINLYYFRDNNKNEVDLIYEKNRKLIPIEIKSAMTLNKDFYRGIKYFQKTSPDSTKGYLIYAGNLYPENNVSKTISFRDILSILSD